MSDMSERERILSQVEPKYHLYGFYPRLTEALVRAENARVVGKYADVRMYLSEARNEIEREIRYHDFDYPTVNRVAPMTDEDTKKPAG